jgi:hypothetical protein
LNLAVEQGKEIAAIKANRFTSSDGLSVWQKIAEIQAQLAEKADEDNVPPPEVIRWLERHDREIDRLGGYPGTQP